MRSENPFRHFVFAGVLAAVLYAIVYSAIEHRRNRNGPWLVQFSAQTGGAPRLIVNQPKLGITNVQLIFPEATALDTNVDVTIDFRTPKSVPYALPLGRCLFMDTTFLPGTLTMEIFGHEVEFLPRVMILNHEEHPWRSGELVEVRRAKAKEP